jgi:curved DNA-binding protein CbpA
LSRDPYEVLEVRRGASTEELHDAYRRMVKLHHPDRNGGSPESTRRFQEVQEAYERVREQRASDPRHRRPAGPPPPPGDPSVEARMRDLERELREAAQAAQAKARAAAREAVRDAGVHSGDRPTDEELGYYSTDDSFGKILADVRDELSGKLSDARKHPAVKRVADIVDGLDGLTSRFEKKP